MKVICINEGVANPGFEGSRDGRWVKAGEIYTVLRTATGFVRAANKVLIGYYLSEMGNDIAFEAGLFIPLSEKDENEMTVSRKEYNRLLKILIESKKQSHAV